MQEHLLRPLEVRCTVLHQYDRASSAETIGYLDNPNATGEDCNFCQYSVGQSFYTPLEIDFATRGRDIGIYVCYVVFNIFVLLLA